MASSTSSIQSKHCKQYSNTVMTTKGSKSFRTIITTEQNGYVQYYTGKLGHKNTRKKKHNDRTKLTNRYTNSNRQTVHLSFLKYLSTHFRSLSHRHFFVFLKLKRFFKTVAVAVVFFLFFSCMNFSTFSIF